MIRVTVELLPYGDATNPQLLGMAYIFNDGTGTKERGNYNYTLTRRGSRVKVLRRGRVEDFPRLSLNVWHLLLRSLKDAFNERKKDE